jgi:flagellar basal-body rod protein FlgB
MNNFEITPEGNGVTLEDEMMKVASNQMDYQAATTLYTRSMRLIKTAIGR